MKRFLSISAATVAIMGGAYAYVICVVDPFPGNWISAWLNHTGTLPDSNISYAPHQMTEGNGTWEVSSNHGGVIGAQVVTGNARCSTEGGVSQGNIHANAPTASWMGVECWCQMTEPWAGPWVFVGNNHGCTSTFQGCHWQCGLTIMNNQAFRRAVIAVH